MVEKAEKPSLPLPGGVREPLDENVCILDSGEAKLALCLYNNCMDRQTSEDKKLLFPKPSLKKVPIIGNIYPDKDEVKIVEFFKCYLDSTWFVWVDEMEDFAKFKILNPNILFSWVANNINVGEVIAINKSGEFLIIFDSYMNYSTYAIVPRIAELFFDEVNGEKYFFEKFDHFLDSNEGGFGIEDSNFIKTYYYPLFFK